MISKSACDNKIINVAIADDEAFVRRALRAYIEEEPDMVIVGDAPDGSSAVDLALETNPDVLLLDLQMPGLDGLGATKELMESKVSTKILIITSHVTGKYLSPLLIAGASGYILKESEPEEIVSAIRDAAAGGCPIAPSMTKHIVEAVRSSAIPAEVQESVDLTDRERDVLGLLCLGKSTQEIGTELFIAEPTVKYHLSSLMQKFEARDRVQLVVRALRSNVF